MTNSNSKSIAILWRGVALAGITIGLQGCPGGGGGGAGPSALYNSAERIGFPAAAGTITIDGLGTEPGWSSAYKVRLEDGAPTAAATIKGVADTDSVYLHVEAEDSIWNAQDALVVGFNATNAADGYKKLIFYPCNAVGGGVCSGGNILDPTVDLQTGTTASGSLVWSGVTSGGPPAGIEVKSNSVAGSPNKWMVEIKINKATFGIPATNYFGLFVDAIATNPGGLGVPATANNFSWPVGTKMSNSSGTIETADMQVPRWGNATLDATKFDAGLQITGFSTTGIDPSKMSLTQPNIFNTTVANYPFGGAGAVDATNVQAVVKVSNSGLATSWSVVPPGTAPVPAGGTVINPQNYKAIATAPWTLATSGTYQTSGLTERQFFTNHPNQCIRVEVTSTGNPMISRQYNMQFVTVNSPFKTVQEIETGAWRKQHRNANAVYLNEYFFNAPDIKWESAFEGATAVSERSWALKSLEGNSARLGLSILPDQSLRLPLDDYQLDVGQLAAGNAIDVKTSPGSVMTFLVDGEAKMGDQAVTPWGAGLSGQAKEGQEGLADKLRPGSVIGDGALIGSFDDFRTSFAIGTGATIYVPASARAMKVKLSGKEQRIEGRWAMQAVTTAPSAAMFDGLDVRSIRAIKNPVLLQLGANLPYHFVRGILDTGETIEIGGIRFNVTVPMGSFGHYIYRVNMGPLFPTGVRPGRPGLDTTGIRDLRPEVLRRDSTIRRGGDVN